MPRILIWPFAGDSRGGLDETDTPQRQRIETAVRVWLECQQQGNRASFIYCSGGLPNSLGVTLAETIRKQVLTYNNDAHRFTILGDEKTTHTAEDIRRAWPKLIDYDEGGLLKYDEVIAVSDPGFLGLPGHTRRIDLLWNRIYPQIPLITITCRPWGSWFYRLRRGIAELAMILWIIFDREGYFFDRFAEGRRRRAREQP